MTTDYSLNLLHLNDHYNKPNLPKMIILAYVLAFGLTFTIGVLLSGVIAFIPSLIHAYIYKEKNGFWTSFFCGGLECFVLLMLSIWIFSWFNFQLPLLYVIIITIANLSNNYYRIKNRSNYNSELGYLVGELIGFPAIYANLLQSDFIAYSFI